MSRDEGFAVMDVDVAIADDPKWRKLARVAPDHLTTAFMAYVATLGASWKDGRRVSVEDAWPIVLTYSEQAVTALQHVGLLDKRGLVSMRAWQQWFGVANERRRKNRDRWTRYNAQRDAVPTSSPRGTNADTATSVPPVLPSSRPPSKAIRDTNPVENGRGPIGLVEPLRTRA